MIRLEKRPQPSRAFSLAAPVLAVLATMVFGGLLFAVLGKDPLTAIRTIFWDPLFGEFAFFYRPQLLIKGAPLVLIDQVSSVAAPAQVLAAQLDQLGDQGDQQAGDGERVGVDRDVGRWSQAGGKGHERAGIARRGVGRR